MHFKGLVIHPTGRVLNIVLQYSLRMLIKIIKKLWSFNFENFTKVFGIFWLNAGKHLIFELYELPTKSKPSSSLLIFAIGPNAL